MIRSETNVEEVRRLRFLEDFVADIEDECLIAGFDISKADVLVAILRDIEEIAQTEFGDGPAFLAAAAAERSEFRRQNVAPLREHGSVVPPSRNSG